MTKKKYNTKSWNYCNASQLMTDPNEIAAFVEHLQKPIQKGERLSMIHIAHAYECAQALERWVKNGKTMKGLSKRDKALLENDGASFVQLFVNFAGIKVEDMPSHAVKVLGYEVRSWDT